jgi:glutamine amidotransferase
MEGIRDGADFYFVHSYYAEPLEVGVIAATTEYAGVEFASFVAKDNIYATQFHPEKSQSVGLKFLQNFIEL